MMIMTLIIMMMLIMFDLSIAVACPVRRHNFNFRLAHILPVFSWVIKKLPQSEITNNPSGAFPFILGTRIGT